MNKQKIFTVRLPDETYKELQAQADARKLNVSDLIRLFIRLGMIASADDIKNPKLFLKDGDDYRPVVLLTT